MTDEITRNDDEQAPFPSLSIENPDAEPTDAAIEALAALLIDSALKAEDQDQNESKVRKP